MTSLCRNFERENLFLFASWEQLPKREVPGFVIQCTDPRIRICIKMSRIWNTGRSVRHHFFTKPRFRVIRNNHARRIHSTVRRTVYKTCWLVQEEPDEERVPGKKILPAMQHTSGVQYIAACNCGSRQANRSIASNFPIFLSLLQPVSRIRIRDPVPFWPGSRIPDPSPPFS